MRADFAELTALRQQLRRLPQWDPPPGAWQRIAGALHTQPDAGGEVPVAMRARRQRHWRLAAIAAAVLPVCAVALLWLRERPVTIAVTATGDAAADVALLVDRSQRLEAVLQELPPRPAVERAATSAAIDALQSRIQLLDMELSSADGADVTITQARQLWGERVQLLNSLLGMRYAEAVRVDVQAATHEGAI